MSEPVTIPNPKILELTAPAGMRIEQTSTRGDGTVALGETFARDDIDFSSVIEHLRIHTEGSVAGSQFNGKEFPTPEDIISSVASALPEQLQYDQHGRAELTLTAEGVVVGYSGVKPLGELDGIVGVRIEQGVRTPGGEPGEAEGIKGAWFPEMVRNPQTGRFEIATNPDGSVKNPHGKFEPEASIAHVDEAVCREALATDKATVIIQKNPESGAPTVLTIFPGENAPAFPTKIESEGLQVDTLQGGPEAEYWAEHAFIIQSPAAT